MFYWNHTTAWLTCLIARVDTSFCAHIHTLILNLKKLFTWQKSVIVNKQNIIMKMKQFIKYALYFSVGYFKWCFTTFLFQWPQTIRKWKWYFSVKKLLVISHTHVKEINDGMFWGIQFLHSPGVSHFSLHYKFPSTSM
jgi:hypothetical protein